MEAKAWFSSKTFWMGLGLAAVGGALTYATDSGEVPSWALSVAGALMVLLRQVTAGGLALK